MEDLYVILTPKNLAALGPFNKKGVNSVLLGAACHGVVGVRVFRLEEISVNEVPVNTVTYKKEIS